MNAPLPTLRLKPGASNGAFMLCWHICGMGSGHRLNLILLPAVQLLRYEARPDVTVPAVVLRPHCL